MPLPEAVEKIIDGQLHQALVRLWQYFRTHHPVFCAQEKSALEDAGAFTACKQRCEQWICENQAMRLRNGLIDHPLALMQALDQYLYQRFNQHNSPQPPKVLIEGRSYYLHRRMIGHSQPPRHTRQAGHLQSWLVYHWVVPADIEGFAIRIHTMPRANLRPGDQWPQNRMRIYFSHFPDGVCPAWTERKAGAMVAHGLDLPEQRWQSIAACLQKAKDEQAHIVVFPELTICPQLRRRISQWLDQHLDNPFYLILPGSFHEKRAGHVYNIAELMSPVGKTLLTHRKLTGFKQGELREGIDTGSRIDLLSTPIGLVGTPICLDFCQEGHPFSRLWDDIGAEWLLVPAFGDQKSLNAHTRRAEAVCRAHNTVCVLANQHPDAEDRDHGFICNADGKTTGKGAQGSSTDLPIYKKT